MFALHKLCIFFASLAVAATASTQIRWLETNHDFGAFREVDGKVSTTFRFVNTGKEKLSIRSVHASCGCTSTSYTRDVIAPGDTAAIEATYNPAGRPGRFTKSIRVDISGVPQRQSLTIEGVVIGSDATLLSRYPVERGPLRLRTATVPFGSVLKGRAKSAFVEVYNADTVPVTPRWEGLPSCMRVASSASSIAPGEQVVYSVVLTPDASAPYGILNTSASLVVDGVEPLPVEFTSIIEEDFSRLTPSQRAQAPVVAVDDDRVTFEGLSRTGQPVSSSFTLYNRGKSDLLIRRIYTTDAGVTIGSYPSKIKKGKKADITVTIDPSQLPADLLSARIQVITNDPEQSLLIMRAIGEVK